MSTFLYLLPVAVAWVVGVLVMWALCAAAADADRAAERHRRELEPTSLDEYRRRRAA